MAMHSSSGGGTDPLQPKPISSTENEAALPLAEDSAVRKSLQRLVARFTADPELQQDLMQECLVCLWRVEAEKPGRTRSWYLQNCRFCVQHRLAAGRSVDSPKRARRDSRLPIGSTGEEPALGDYHTDGQLFDAISFRDVVTTLDGRLDPGERKVFHGLASGLTLSEIAVQSGLSYPTVLKYRRNIASLAVRLHIAPPSSPGQNS